MKQSIPFTAGFIVFMALLFSSCKKDRWCDNCNGNTATNSPFANAGFDQIITLPEDSVLLDGSQSGDPHGKISAWQWSKIAGPASITIVDPKAAKTMAKGLVEGVYQCELAVTNERGLVAKDTVQVRVTAAVATVACGNSSRPVVPVQLVPVGLLSQPRQGLSVASAGNKILFAGGLTSTGGNSSRVDIYDLTTHTWTSAELSEARYAIAAVANGTKIFFGGGEVGDGSFPTKTVDVYDASANRWTQSALSIAGNRIAAAAVGNKVLFAGGDAGFTLPWPANWVRTTRVDIYDLTMNTWSTASLGTVRRGGHAAVTANNKVYISGGETWPPDPVPGTWYCSSTIDVYDNATNSWSASALEEGKLGHAGIAVNDKIF